MQEKTPRILAVTGVDGSGKTTIAEWMYAELERRGYKPTIVWSRFNNLVSLPFLLATRLTGHNYYQINEEVRMGYHDFQNFPAFLRWLFVWMQIVDVNIASQRRIMKVASKHQVIICERGPWDTLVDVASDTGFMQLSDSPYIERFMGSVAPFAHILLIDRDLDLIRGSRPELDHDVRIEFRQHYYRRLASNCHWGVLENNDTLDSALKKANEWLNSLGY
jgi:hypothetical protein